MIQALHSQFPKAKYVAYATSLPVMLLVGMARTLHRCNTLQKRKYLENGAVSGLLTFAIVFYG